MLEWNVLGSCLYNGQYERHIENTSNPMQGWQKQIITIFVICLAL